MEDKRTIIVGASRGIGSVLAKKLAEQGHKLILLARSEDDLKAVCSYINMKYGFGRAEYRVHDVLDTGSVRGLLDDLISKLGGLDNLIFVSGILNVVDWDEFELEKELQMLRVNLLGGVAWIGTAAEYFKKRGSGLIVGVSSVAGDRGRAENPAYYTSKAGLNTYLESLRNRLFKDGVRVLTVKPGRVNTDLISELTGMYGAVPPERIAKDIWRAMRKKKQVVYTPWWWRYVLLMIQHVPSFIFRRIKI
jgi:short-subunit dehydrogenase